MAGIRGAPDNATKYPLASGEAAFAAIDQMVRLLNAAQAARIPIFFRRYVVDPVNGDVGVFQDRRRYRSGREPLFRRHPRDDRCRPEAVAQRDRH
jgi:hypothetical protein